MKVIDNWRNATEEVAKAFVKKYFKREVYGQYTFWVADEIGGVFSVGDYFFDINRMIEALELKATFKQLIDYYDAEVDHHSESPDMPFHTNFKNYVKYGWIGKKENN